MDYIKNVQLSVDNIEILTKIIAGRYLYLKREYDNLQPLLTTTDEVEGSKLRKTILPARPMLALNLETKGHTETYTDAESFLGELKNNLRDVEKINIDYSALYYEHSTIDSYYRSQRSEERVYFSITPDTIMVSTEKDNASPEFDKLLNGIKDLIASLPQKCDKIVTKKSTYKWVPALNVSMLLGIILLAADYILFKFNIIDYGLKEYALSPWVCVIVFAVAFLLSVGLSGANHRLYRELGLKQKYIGYDMSKGQDITTEDLSQIKDTAEVEMGENYKSRAIREKINANLKKAKIKLFIELIVYAVLAVLFLI